MAHGSTRAWMLAIGITLVAAAYQRVTGPTYPVRGSASIAGNEVRYRLARSHGGDGGQTVAIRIGDPAVAGDLLWRRFPTQDPMTTVPMNREGDRLVAEIPHQPAAGKVEYHIRLRKGEGSAPEAVLLPTGSPVVTRFKGHVPAIVLLPHVLLMFLGMLYSTRAGIEVFRRERRLFPYAWGTAALLFAGGLILGPLVQKGAFGEYWTGIPFGYDLTDNKTLIAFVAWLVAALLARRPRIGRAAVLLASIATLAVFAIPHSVHGSQYDYRAATMEGPAGADGPAGSEP